MFASSGRIGRTRRPIALVVAQTLEQARAAAGAIRIDYHVQPHDVGFHLDHPASRPASTAFGPEADTGDVDAELATAAMVVDERYHTPEECHSAVEPHAATAWWGLRRQGAVWSAGDPRRDGR